MSFYPNIIDELESQEMKSKNIQGLVADIIEKYHNPPMLQFLGKLYETQCSGQSYEII